MKNQIAFIEKLQKDFAQMCKNQANEIEQQRAEIHKTYEEIRKIMSQPIGAR